ncbi:hypothetical protein JG687_00015079 [Phytophthora cactorum]|uniref:Uncharacterized protein n=1 Tax=Phytophthora cactorum TaxID=29920 RepID=A0A8T1TXR1_9STRA|nr:hypothetical protein PC119_g24764 [Phytophthora cactorum]KAG4039400.1 hypothetical protein PC123_g25050 [Phytophthora cactorum]KAG4227771.1 hypothetical protein PC116_g23860 [Phytophthora cactorum]KAG6949098.1 hypothetical protein JG687_00015079 [Phytophthora cactorum]
MAMYTAEEKKDVVAHVHCGHSFSGVAAFSGILERTIRKMAAAAQAWSSLEQAR